VNTARSTATYP